MASLSFASACLQLAHSFDQPVNFFSRRVTGASGAQNYQPD
jgi:hypothetical protein